MQFRNTVQRQVVLEAVRRIRSHPTADEVYAAINREHPSISKATVYRNLHQLAAQGEILQVAVPNGADRFDFRTDEHYHVCCTGCGRVFDVLMPPVEGIMERVTDSSGVELTRYEIMFEGICPSCREDTHS